MEKNENIDICRECGGKCCLKCGCDYGVSDFTDRSYEALLKVLNEGDKSIVATFDFRVKKNGRYVAEPILHIRARNTNRDVVDLVSMKTRCSQLGENGCMYDYDHRPLGGRNLKPSSSIDEPCRPIISPLYILNTWMPYQKQLRKIVKHYTGMSVNRKIRQDVEDLIYEVLMENFDDISPLELIDLKEFVPMLFRAFPKEARNAFEKYDKNSSNILMRKNSV